MQIWDPHHPATYLLHILLGMVGLLAAVVALASRKGTTPHVRAGTVFAFAAIVAAVTALLFSATRLSLFAVISSLIVISLVWGAILALRTRSAWVRVGEYAASMLMMVSLLGLLVMAALPLLAGAPLVASAWPAAYALFPLWFVAGDWRYYRLDANARQSRRFARHLSRMAFALAIAVHAPIVSFGDDWGIHPVMAFFGPFVLWPLLVHAFRNHRLVRAVPVAGVS